MRESTQFSYNIRKSLGNSHRLTLKEDDENKGRGVGIRLTKTVMRLQLCFVYVGVSKDEN